MRKATNLPIVTKPPAKGRLFFCRLFMQDYTTQRRTIVGYRCPSSRALLPTPDGPNCVMEVTEVDEPVSYIVSTGDDGFIAENDQKIPLRSGANPAFENNFRAGERSSCNHFTEGNHPEVNRHLRTLLLTSGSPFFIP